MTPTARIRLLVGLAALVAAAIVAGVVYATRQDPTQPKVACRARPFVVTGVKSRNVAAVRAAMALPERAAARKLAVLAQAYPADPVVQFNDAVVLECAGFLPDAVAAYERARKTGFDTYYEVQSDVLLHPQYFQQGGYPPFQYSGHDRLLVQGAVAQQGYHQHTAEKLWARAAAQEPGSDVAQVAAAVGLFSMSDPSKAFSHLGPLVKRFPRSQSVRFHLGLMLTYLGETKQARLELQKAAALGAETVLGRQARRLLRGFVASGTSPPKR